MDELIIHYWQLPKDLFISLSPQLHIKLCLLIQKKTLNNCKNCFYEILKCPKWHAQRLFTRFNRMTIKEIEILREFADISREEIEREIESVGCHERRTIINNPKFPFQLRDLFYVASHLMFDGCYRERKGCYFYSYETSLVDYHRKRLYEFGEVPINFGKNDNHLYFSYAIGYITKNILEIDNFRSTKTFLSKKMKDLAKDNKILTDEIVKAIIIDEGNIEDKIEAELANERLIKDLYEVASRYYRLTKIASRTIKFKDNPKWTHTTTLWNIGFSAKSFQDLHKSISPLPIDYKEENLKFLFERKNRLFNQRKAGETKKLIVKSLLENPKTIEELSKELFMKQTTVRAHLKGHPTYNSSLIGLSFVDRISEKILRRGGYAKVGIYGVTDINKAKEFLNI